MTDKLGGCLLLTHGEAGAAASRPTQVLRRMARGDMQIARIRGLLPAKALSG